jgi:hypothetical protein
VNAKPIPFARQRGTAAWAVAKSVQVSGLVEEASRPVLALIGILVSLPLRDSWRQFIH